MVDQWLSDLIKYLAQGGSSAPKRGLWDRFKAGASNLFYGRDNKENPYYYINRFGDDFGSEGSWRDSTKSECFNPGMFTLREYGLIKGAVEMAEAKAEQAFLLAEAEFGNLRIVSMLKQAATELKSKISSLILGSEAASDSGEASDDPRPSTRPAPIPGAEKRPGPSVPGPGPEPSTRPAPIPGSGGKPSASEPENKTEPSTSPATAAGSESKKSSSDDSEGEDKETKVVKAKKNTFLGSLEEAIRALRERRYDSLNPDASWLTKKGKLSAVGFPMAVAWLSMKNHVDISNDNHVERELSKAFGEEFKGMDKIKGGNTLATYIVRWAPEGLGESKLKDLGVDEDVVRKTIENYSKESNEVQEPKSNNKLKDLIEKHDEIKGLISELENILIKPVFQKTPKEDRASFISWWKHFKETNDDLESLKIKMLNGDDSELIDDLKRISGLNQDEIIGMIS